MSVYLDTSVLVAIFSQDAFTARAERFLGKNSELIVVSDFGAAEFSSAIARRVRNKELSRDQASDAFTLFDGWTARQTHRTTIPSQDLAAAVMFVRRIDLSLRAPDAVHLAVSHRVADQFLTFDKRMADAAQVLGLNVFHD